MDLEDHIRVTHQVAVLLVVVGHGDGRHAPRPFADVLHLRVEAKALVEKHKDAIVRVADALMAGKVLSHDEVVALIKPPEQKAAD